MATAPGALRAGSTRPRARSRPRPAAGQAEPLHIVQIAPPWYQVPPDGYGGIELVVALLVDGLRARGHRVTLFAAEGSPDADSPAPHSWSAALGTPEERLRELGWAMRIVEGLAERDGVDVVHDHVGHATLVACALSTRAPLFHTAHGPMAQPYRDFYASLDGRVSMVAISESQRRSAPELPWAATVQNAVDTASLHVRTEPDSCGYLLWLARITPDKGQHIAIEVARRTGMRLVLAGKLDDADGREYWERMVAPAVDGDRVVHLPNVVGAEKAALLAGARALVAPLCWEEPFGLALAEAMASGTPVVAMARGAAPELVEEGVTGFLVEDADAMVDAVRRVGDIDRRACAARARERFDARTMADGYLHAYTRALAGGVARASGVL